MSALDEAVARHMAHPAGGHDDPLTTSLDEQFACSTQHAPLAPRLREGWKHEPIVVPHCWWFYALCFFAAMLLVGCGGGDCDEPPPEDGRVYLPADPCKTNPKACL